MLWVDHQSYFGPDRRRKLGGKRLLERRRCNYAAPAPAMTTALRQLRMRVLEARGAGADAFAARSQGVAVLARMQGEHQASCVLLNLSARALEGRAADVRASLYQGLDRAHAALGGMH